MNNKHFKKLENALVVGAGGVGSEVIKLLVGMNLKTTVIDYDTIEITNLNRQFYFVESDRSKFKSELIGAKTNCFYKICNVKDLSPSYLDTFDIVFSCLDSVSSRMELNYLFFRSKCELLIDCGVEGSKFHIKKVSKSSSCLYCIKDIYNMDKMPFICSLSNIDVIATDINRDKVLRSLIFKMKGENESISYEKIVESFNEKANKALQTTVFEVKGIFEDIIPSVCFTNSICASNAVIIAFSNKNADFYYFDGEIDMEVSEIIIEKDESCFVCKKTLK
jgi:ubiquitin-activating enzyme E1 C